MSKFNIFKRKVIDEILKYLDTPDIIVLHGARQTGKTSILLYLINELNEKKLPNYYIDLEDFRLKEVLDNGPEELVKLLKENGFNTNEKVFVLIDEIQYLKNPSSFLKLTYDHYKNLKLIVSGSSSFEIKSKFKDSLAGRTLEFEIFPLSFEEFMIFKNSTLYGTDFTAKKIEELKIYFKEYVLYGGYPKIVLTDDIELKEKYLKQLIDTYIKKDIRDLASVKDVYKFNKLLEVLSSQSGNILNVYEISNLSQLSKQTVEKYLFILENTYIIRRLKPFSGNLRNELFKSPKIFFYDTGLMQILWLKSLQKEIIGNVFETAIFSELAKKFSGDCVFYWRTTDKKEIDFILKEKEKILPIEVKLNFEQFKPLAIRYFSERYCVSDYRVVSLYGEVKDKFSIYPWQLKGEKVKKNDGL
jgi:predicted AAA+ superfamily ATPase